MSEVKTFEQWMHHNHQVESPTPTRFQFYYHTTYAGLCSSGACISGASTDVQKPRRHPGRAKHA